MSGGWSVEYADAFGSCLTDPATHCSLGGPRRDNTTDAITSANGFGAPHEEAAFEPSEVNVGPDGLELRCDEIANLGMKYTCGALRAGPGNGAVNVPAPYNWSFAPNRHFVVQYAWQLPDNAGYMDDPAVWSTGVNWAWEIDFPECWGYGASNSPADHGWLGKNCGLPAIPQDTGGATGGGSVKIGSTPGVPADPSTALHTYTIDMNDDASGTLTITTYIDGTQISQSALANFSGSPGKLILANDMRLNKACGWCDTGTFPAGGNQEIIRYVAVYEPKSANHAGSTGVAVVPGTTVN